MSTEDEPTDTPTPRADRRRRHADDPVMTINVTLPVSLVAAIDDRAVAQHWTRSAVVRDALERWIAQQDPSGEES